MQQEMEDVFTMFEALDGDKCSGGLGFSKRLRDVAEGARDGDDIERERLILTRALVLKRWAKELIQTYHTGSPLDWPMACSACHS